MITLDSPILLVAGSVAVLALLVAGFTVHDRTTRRLAWGATLWLVLSLGYLRRGELPILLHRMPTDPITRLVGQAYDVAWWLALAWLVVRLIDVVLWRLLYPGAHPGGRKLIADLVSVFIYLGGFLAILAFTFEQDISGVLATSGVVAIVLGFALQNSLGEIVSGLFMSVEAPYRAGDWITIDDKIEGQVMETNWRATRLKTRTGDTLILPNSVIAKAQIVNRYFPDATHTAQFMVTIDARTPPDRAVDVLTAAVLAAPGIRHEPAPEVLVWALNPKSIDYRISFAVDDFEHAQTARHEVMRRIWIHLFWAGIRMDDAPVISARTAETEADRVAALEKDLASLVLLTPFLTEERCALARRYRTQVVAAGTTLVKQGNPGDSMFLIGEGVLTVLLEHPGLPEREVGRLGPGEYFGEMSLLTGAVRSATVRALTDVCVHELAKADLAPILTARPALAAQLGRHLAARRKSLAEAEHEAALADDTADSYAERIGSWISAFFHS